MGEGGGTCSEERGAVGRGDQSDRGRVDGDVILDLGGGARLEKGQSLCVEDTPPEGGGGGGETAREGGRERGSDVDPTSS
jgi:hypothetical protein